MLFALAGSAVPSDAKTDAKALSRPYERFGLNLLKQAVAASPNSNVFISPTGIAVALAMAANGASGSTRAAMLKTLGVGGMSMDSFDSANHALAASLTGSRGVQLSMANGMWLQHDFPVNASFQKAAHDAFGAQIANLDFKSPSAVNTVNSWVDKHTGGRIPKILDSIDPGTIALLANAIAFKGKWKLPFDPKETKSHPFMTSTGNSIQAPMMSNTATYAYAETNGAQAIRLPYGDGSYSMYVVLPTRLYEPLGVHSLPNASLNGYVGWLTSDRFDAMVASLHDQKGTIELPRFSITWDATLNKMLENLGMAIAFSDAANFDAIHKAPPHLAITQVRHSSFLKVDEQGTEASGATTITIGLTAIRETPPPFLMVVDRPFLVAIRDDRNGQLLFVGAISKPA
jgi:serine protease inhibitor